MANTIEIRTNNVPRYTVDGFDLTDKERQEFDYYTSEELDMATFFRFKGRVYDLAEFSTTQGLPEFNPLTQWHGYCGDSFFSGVLVKYSDDMESVIVGQYFS